MTYPDSPGFKKAGTSEAAATATLPRAGTLRRRVYDTLAAAPEGLTADEIAGRLGETPFSIRPRVTELLQSGLVLEGRATRRNRSGRQASVWYAAAVAPPDLLETIR